MYGSLWGENKSKQLVFGGGGSRLLYSSKSRIYNILTTDRRWSEVRVQWPTDFLRLMWRDCSRLWSWHLFADSLQVPDSPARTSTMAGENKTTMGLFLLWRFTMSKPQLSFVCFSPLTFACLPEPAVKEKRKFREYLSMSYSRYPHIPSKGTASFDRAIYV